MLRCLNYRIFLKARWCVQRSRRGLENSNYGIISLDVGNVFPTGGLLNDLRLKCGTDKQIQKNNITNDKIYHLPTK